MLEHESTVTVLDPRFLGWFVEILKGLHEIVKFVDRDRGTS